MYRKKQNHYRLETKRRGKYMHSRKLIYEELREVRGDHITNFSMRWRRVW
jgi:hypothetical protein